MIANNKILRSNRISEENLRALLSDEILLLIVSNFYSEECSNNLTERILNDSKIEKYTHETVEDSRLVQKYYGVDRLGSPFNLIYGKALESESVKRYYNEVPAARERLRRLANPALTPIDKLRLELDEHYFHGATVANFQGRKMFTGIIRITRADMSHLSEEQPHFDALPHEYAKLDAQFAANIYLKVPTRGGELEIWDVPPVDPLSSAPSDWRAELPQSVKIAPKVGDLIIFNSRRPHAICAFSGEDRVSAQTFIGYRQSEPLKLWN